MANPLKISFRLQEEHAQKLTALAEKAKMSEHEFARFLVVEGLLNPETPLKKDLYELTLDTEFAISEIRELRSDNAKLRVQIAAIASLLLTKFADIDPKDADLLIDEIFSTIDGKRD